MGSRPRTISFLCFQGLNLFFFSGLVTLSWLRCVICCAHFLFSGFICFPCSPACLHRSVVLRPLIVVTPPPPPSPPPHASPALLSTCGIFISRSSRKKASAGSRCHRNHKCLSTSRARPHDEYLSVYCRVQGGAWVGRGGGGAGVEEVSMWLWVFEVADGSLDPQEPWRPHAPPPPLAGAGRLIAVTDSSFMATVALQGQSSLCTMPPKRTFNFISFFFPFCGKGG